MNTGSRTPFVCCLWKCSHLFGTMILREALLKQKFESENQKYVQLANASKTMEKNIKAGREENPSHPALRKMVENFLFVNYSKYESAKNCDKMVRELESMKKKK